MTIPEVFDAYNVYVDSNKLVGVAAQFQLPSATAITDTISGAGVMGEYEASVPGFFSSMEQEITFNHLGENVFSTMSMGESVDITVRASTQLSDSDTFGITHQSMRVVERGRFKEFNGGTIEQAKKASPSVKYEVLYLYYELNGQEMLEIDKLNSIYRVNGVDMYEAVRNNV